MEESGDIDKSSELNKGSEAQEVIAAEPVGTKKNTGLSSEIESDRGGIVTARGTGDGLTIRLDGRVGVKDLSSALKEFVTSRESFLAGNEVALEWIGSKPELELEQRIKNDLSKQFKIKVKSSELKEIKSGRLADQVERISEPQDEKLSLFDGIENLGYGKDSLGNDISLEDDMGVERLGAGASAGVQDSSLWDDPDARMVYKTLRSGQKIESEHTLVIIGDVNSGAELIAGGDVIVLGTLRGVVHAGAYDETGGGRFIFALNLQPTQLRIGAVISRGGPDSSKYAEIARVDGNIIVVEPYQARQAMARIRK